MGQRIFKNFLIWQIILGFFSFLQPISILAKNKPSIKAQLELKKARIFLRTEQLDLALKSLKLALNLLPNYAEALHVRGAIFYRKKRFEEAYQDWKDACLLQTEWCQGLEFFKYQKPSRNL